MDVHCIRAALTRVCSIAQRSDWMDFYSEDAAMSVCLKRAEVAAATDLPVLILGESGTGKTLLARAIHNSSLRGARSFVSFSSPALSDTLLDSQLFGHERGAFTGAHQGLKGKFELADGGTLFIDEIADMSSAAQAKILRAVGVRRVRASGLRGAPGRGRPADFSHLPSLVATLSVGALPPGPLLSHQRDRAHHPAAAREAARSAPSCRCRDRPRLARATQGHHRPEQGGRRPHFCLLVARQPSRIEPGDPHSRRARNAERHRPGDAPPGAELRDRAGGRRDPSLCRRDPPSPKSNGATS